MCITITTGFVMGGLIIGNWKMNGNVSDACELTTQICEFLQEQSNITLEESEIVICPPFHLLSTVAEQISNHDTTLLLGAQNCSSFSNGAHTGEISAEMLEDVGASFVIIGHSERRHYNHEDSHEISLKLKQAYEYNLVSVLCVGENEQERNNGEANKVIEKQLDAVLNASFFADKEDDMIVIAYEPIWAIGSGKIPSKEDIASIVLFIKETIANQFGFEDVPVLYGGSVSSDNVRNILDIDVVDGVLVGGASLDANKFNKIILEATKELQVDLVE